VIIIIIRKLSIKEFAMALLSDDWRDGKTGQWYRTHGNEHWEFDDEGLMRIRDMSANDIPIKESERRYRG